jgi:hypothetical protein
MIWKTLTRPDKLYRQHEEGKKYQNRSQPYLVGIHRRNIICVELELGRLQLYSGVLKIDDSQEYLMGDYILPYIYVPRILSGPLRLTGSSSILSMVLSIDTKLHVLSGACTRGVGGLFEAVEKAQKTTVV